jgi:MFS family permease
MKTYKPINNQWKNVIILGICEALAMSINSILLIVDPLIGITLIDEKSQATAPIAVFQVAGMLATFPASFLMKWFGRRWGFVLGTLIGIIGIAIGIYGLLNRSIILFFISTFLMGFYGGFSGFYQFAAADAVRESDRGKAISWVLAGGILAGLMGPLLVVWTQNIFKGQLFIGSFLSIFVLQFITLFSLLFLDINSAKEAGKKEKSDHFSVQRSFLEVIKQSNLIIPLFGGICSYGTMVLVMTAAPLAMSAHPDSIDHTALSMQFHLIGMFIPSLFTGQLISKFGTTKIMILGAVINLISVSINMNEVSLENMCLSLLFLGIGWNFMFISATTLLTASTNSENQAMIQAVYEFCILFFVSIFVYASGWIMDQFGWATLNLISIPIVLIFLIKLIFPKQERYCQEK